MRKVFVFIAVFLLAFLILASGCSKAATTKKVVSKPVTAKPVGEVPTPTTAEEPAATTEPALVVEEKPVVTPAGVANCEQLSGTDLTNVFGGTWTKASDCPQRPAMPKGVNVCLCAYEGPKHTYVNVETQLYDADTEALRVYNMYCKGAVEQNEVGDKSCRFNRTSTMTPSFVYFLQGKYFAKISCLGGKCPLDAIAFLAQNVSSKI
jgi:hypothetical protein